MLSVIHENFVFDIYRTQKWDEQSVQIALTVRPDTTLVSEPTGYIRWHPKSAIHIICVYTDWVNAKMTISRIAQKTEVTLATYERMQAEENARMSHV
jgi:hypothetical protein